MRRRRGWPRTKRWRPACARRPRRFGKPDRSCTPAMRPAGRSLIRRLAGLLLAAVLALGGCTTGDDPGPAVPVDPAVIYAQMCARYHGVNGRGDPEIRKTLPTV